MNKQAWIECAQKKGIQEFEIYQSVNSQKEVTWYEGQMDTFVSSSIVGTSIRGIVNGNMANIALEKVEDEKMESVLDSLIEQAHTISKEEKDKIRKPEPFDAVITNKTWIHPDMNLVKDTLEAIEKKCLAYDSRISQVADLIWQEAKGRREITNSYGMDLQDADEVQMLMVSVVASENGQSKVDEQVEIVYDLSKFDVDEFVKKSCDKVLLRLNSKSVPSQKTKVILEKSAMTSLLSAFMQMFSGDLLYKGISPLKDKQNKKIFSNLITLIDNPRNLDALSIANFDDEGCPTREKVLVDQGVFITALHDTQSASRMHTESTGNGFKSGYASSVSVYPMNSYIVPGSKSLDELCAEMKDGLVITDLAGLHAGINFVTTNFSLQCEGYWIKDGKREKSVSLITIADNFLDLMNKVIEVGNDLDWSYHQVVSPSILFCECAISGE